MGRATRPVYICDKCSKEFLDPKRVRTFVGNVTDGEKSLFIGDNIIKKSNEKVYKEGSDLKINTKELMIFSNMYCLECIPEVLNLSGDTFHMTDLEKELEFSVEDVPLTIEEEEEELTIDEENEIEESEEESEEEYSEESEEQIEEDENAIKYRVFGKIETTEQESYAAEICGYESINELRETYGGPLTGIYVDTKQTTTFLPDSCETKEVQIIDGVLFGIPNIKTVVALVKDDKHAFIEIEDGKETDEENITT